MQDVKSSRCFAKALNESLDGGSLFCQLSDMELNKYVMNLTTAFCRNQQEANVPRSSYIKIAAACLGRQPGSDIWVLNERVQFHSNGEKLSVNESPYVWLGALIGRRNLPGVPINSDAAIMPDKTEDPKEALSCTLQALKAAVDNNYVPAFMVIAAALLCTHYETVFETYGMCPTPIVIGKKNTGKSTAARTSLYLLGVPQKHFIREFTDTQTTSQNARKTFPSVFDDPDKISQVKSLIDNTFNGGARATAKESVMCRSASLVTLNFDRVNKLCGNYKYVGCTNNNHCNAFFPPSLMQGS